MLTEQQRNLLLFIHQRLQDRGVPPSFDEMKDALDLKSKSGIHRLISALVERGYLAKLPNRARALEVKKLPENYQKTDSKSSNSILNSLQSVATSVMELPLMGKIAAGTPIEAIRSDHDTIEIPPSLIGSGEHYALKVEGDSMIKAGINDGDIVIIKKVNTVPNGRIVVALIDDQEVTLKRLYRQDGKIVLEAENDAYKPRILNPDRVQIQGELASLMRSYH
jgi:repressor LexA